jgi:RHS repeat-associated protein
MRRTTRALFSPNQESTSMRQISSHWIGRFAALALLVLTGAASAQSTVTLTAPANNSNSSVNTAISLAANTTGTVNRVRFKQNGTYLGFGDNTDPYTGTYTPTTAGTYVFVAEAMAGGAIVATSAPITVNVGAGGTGSSPTGVFQGIDAAGVAKGTASDADRPGQSIAVDFYVGTGFTTYVGETWTQASNGNFTFQIPAQFLNGASQTICAWAINETAPHTQIGCKSTVSSGSAPVGVFQGIDVSGLATGTASDADRPGQSIEVDFWLDDGFTNFVGSTSTQASNGAFSFQVPAQFFGGPSMTLCAWAINQTAPHTQIGCKSTVGNSGSGPGSITRTYVYDATQRLCKTIDPESNATLMDYDAAGNIAWVATGTYLTSPVCDRDKVTDDMKVKRYYDSMNRLKSVVTPGHVADVTKTYTPDGLIESTVQANSANNGTLVTTTYAYNKRRLLQSETSAQTGWYSWPVQYTYDANGHLSSTTFPNSGIVFGYAPDALGRPTQVGSFASGISYYPNGAIKQFTYGNGVVHTMTQNLRGLPARSQDMNGSTPILDDSYTFDANGNVDDIIDQAQGTSRGMAYDGLDRLKTAVSMGTASLPMWGTAHYTYDLLDNLRGSTLGSSGFSYNYDASNRLASLDRTGGGTYAYSYDANGNVSNDGRRGYEFDATNRLLGVTGKEYYRYDGQGRRVLSWRPTGPNQTTLYMYSQSGQVLYEEGGPNNESTTNVYLGNTLVAARVYSYATGVESIRYQHTDALGSPVAVSDAGRNVVARTIYAPYGAPVDHPVDGVGYTGHVMDQTTGLTYMQQRYYDPQVGRFLSNDPVMTNPNTGASFNRYWYATGNPYRFTDPDGRQSVGELIDSGAEGCGAMTCAGWAFMSASWSVFGAEGVSQVLDKGNDASTGDKIMAGVEVATLGQGGKVGAAAKVVMGVAKELAPAARMARAIGKEFGAVGAATKNGAGTVFRLADGKVTVRVMESGGGRTNYLRVSVEGKGSIDAAGKFSSDPKATHLEFGNDALRMIKRLVNGF